MKGLSKKLIIVVASVLVLGIVAVLPGFAETQDQLKQVFVTRKEVGSWVKYASDKMEWAESVANWQVFKECSKEMSIRGVDDPNTDPIPSTTPPAPTYSSDAYPWP